MGLKIILAALCAMMLFAPGDLSAQSGFTDFSAKRVKPPKAGSKSRINVQIAPRTRPSIAPPPVNQRAPLVAAPVPSTGKPSKGKKTRSAPIGSYAWYWENVSPDLSATGPGRLQSALIGLAKGPGGQSVASPRLQTLQDMASRFGMHILRETVGTQVSPALALAVISVESAGRNDAVSHAGAQGLMQLMPATAERFGVSNALDAGENIRGGVKFLDFLMKKFDGDPILVLAGYNAGENSIGRNGGVPPYAETRDYVPKVLAAFKTASGLCLTPPQLVSDGCVFRVSGSQ